MRQIAKLCCGLGVALLLASAPLLADKPSSTNAAGDTLVIESAPKEAIEGAAEAVECDQENPGDEQAAADTTQESEDQPEVEQVYPTHKQTKLIDVNQDDLEKTKLRSFCLQPDGTILAACGGPSGGRGGEVRLFDPAGEYLSSWELSVDPEAINVGSDGYVYIAGEGKLLRLSADGKVDPPGRRAPPD